MLLSTIIIDSREKEVISRMYSVPELAQKLGVHRATVHRWVQKGLLPAIRVGTGRKFYLIPEETLPPGFPQRARKHRKERFPGQQKLL